MSEEQEESLTGRDVVVVGPGNVREVLFYEDVLLVVLVDGEPFVAVRPIVEHLGVDWASQYQRMQRDDILTEAKKLVRAESADGKQREMVAIPLDLLPGFLFGITGSRLKNVKPEMAAKLKLYRRECFKVLWREFGGYPTVVEEQAAPPVTVVVDSYIILESVRDTGLALAQMAEEQMVLTERVTGLESAADLAKRRLDGAARVVVNMQNRLEAVEHRVMPYECISEDQASEISLAVKALAELLTRQAALGKTEQKNYYQGVFSELYRRFGVTKYSSIRQADYQRVMAFLEDWRQAASVEKRDDEGSQPT